MKISTKGRIATVRRPTSGTTDRLLAEKNQQTSRIARSIIVRSNLLLRGAQTRAPTTRTSEDDLISFLILKFNNSNVYLAEYLPFYGIDNELLNEI